MDQPAADRHRKPSLRTAARAATDALRRTPWIVLVPLLWNALFSRAASWLVTATTGNYISGSSMLNFRVLMVPVPPLSLPKLGLGPLGTLTATVGRAPGQPSVTWIVIAASLSVLAALVAAGFLHLARGALRGEARVAALWVGIRRYGLRLLGRSMLGFAAVLVALRVAQVAPLAVRVVVPLAVVWFFLADLLIVARDLALPAALVRSGPALARNIITVALLVVAGLIVLGTVSGLSDTLLTRVGHTQAVARTLDAVVPVIYSTTGTWLTLALLAVLNGTTGPSSQSPADPAAASEAAFSA